MAIDLLNGVVFLSIKIMVLAGVTVLLLNRSRNTSSANLHNIAVLALLGIFLIPLIMLSLPSIALPVVPESWSAALQSPLNTQLQWLFAVYLLIASAFISHLLYELVVLRRLHSGKVIEFPARYLNLALRIQEQLGLRRKVNFVCNHKVRSPMSWGCVKPQVAMPMESLLWTEDRFRRVLIHELAHIKRRDWLTKIVAHIVAAIFWFIPGVRLLKRKIDWFSELACDDWVLGLEKEGLSYASDLLSLSQLDCKSRRSSMANALTGSNNIYSRIGAVLDSSRVRFYTAFETTFYCVVGSILVVFFAMLKIETYSKNSSLPAVFFHEYTLAEKQKSIEAKATGMPENALVSPVGLEPILEPSESARAFAQQAFYSAKAHVEAVDFAPMLEARELSSAAFLELRELGVPPKQVEYALLHSVRPEYPKRALQRGIEADVTVTFDISPSGLVQNVRTQSSSGLDVFEQAASAALEQYYFQPRFENGRPVVSKNIKEHFQFRIIEGAN